MTDTLIPVGAARTVFEAGLFYLDPLTPEYQQDWHRLNREALAHGPVAMGPFGPAVLGYEAVQFALRDRRFESPPGLGLAVQGITEGPLWERATRSILALNGDEHSRLRRLVSRAFTPKCAQPLQHTMTEVINGLIDKVAAEGHCDVVADIARPYPIPIVCELLGAPRDDWERISAWTDDVFKIFSLNLADDGPVVLRAFEELDVYIDDMVERRRHSLTGDLVSQLIRAEDDGDRLSHDELKMLVGAILTAGTDTTRNQLAAAIELFCDHPAQWAMLAEDPSLAYGAVEEVLRYSPILLGTMRITTDDVELCDMTIPAGSFVDVNCAAANRDPSVFPDPDRFDITRLGAAPMLTFGGGVHYCLGVHLAKAELATALAVMAWRMPNLRRTGPCPWKSIIGISGPEAVPIAFDPGH